MTDDWLEALLAGLCPKCHAPLLPLGLAHQVEVITWAQPPVGWCAMCEAFAGRTGEVAWLCRAPQPPELRPGASHA